MRLDSLHARHKLIFTALLLALFAAPFVAEWQAIVHVDTSTFMTAGARIGTLKAENASTIRQTNSAGVVTSVAGESLTSTSH